MELQREVQRFDMRGSPQNARDVHDLPLEYSRGVVAVTKTIGTSGNNSARCWSANCTAGAPSGNQRVERTIAELQPDVIPQRGVGRRAKFFVLQELGVVVDLDGRMRIQDLRDDLVELRVARECLRAGMNRQHAFDRTLRGRGLGPCHADGRGRSHEHRPRATSQAHQNDNFAAS